MKKILSLLAAGLIAAFSSAPASAAEHYASGFGGISWMRNLDVNSSYHYGAPLPLGSVTSQNVDLGSGVNLLGAVGCDYGDYRLEAEVGYQRNNVKSGIDYNNGVVINYAGQGVNYSMRGNVSALSLLGNGYYDFDLGSKVEFYLTAGGGVAQVSLHDVDAVYALGVVPLTANPNPGNNDHSTTLAYQLGGGFAVPVANTVKLDLRYRYFATTDFSVAGGFNGNIASHSVLLGLRVNF